MSASLQNHETASLAILSHIHIKDDRPPGNVLKFRSAQRNSILVRDGSRNGGDLSQFGRSVRSTYNVIETTVSMVQGFG
jgi:hypothetical protein